MFRMGRERIDLKYQSEQLHGYVVMDSSNIQYVGWKDGSMFVLFKGDSLYRYEGVSRQRAVACALAESVGKYLNQKIKPNYSYTRAA